MGTLSTTARPQGARSRNAWHGVTLRFDPLGRGNGDADTYALDLTNTDGFNTVVVTRSGITTVALTASATNVNGTATLAVTRANTVTATNTTNQSPSLAHGVMSEGSRLRWSRFALDGGSGSVDITLPNNAASQALTRSELAGSIARPANDSGTHSRTWTVHLTDGHNTRVITSGISLPPISGSARVWNPGTNFNGHHGTRSICVEQNGTLHAHTWVTGGWVNGASVGNGGCNNYLGDGQSIGGHVQVHDGVNSRDFGGSAGTNAMPRPAPIAQVGCSPNSSPRGLSGSTITFSTTGNPVSTPSSHTCGAAGSVTRTVNSVPAWCYTDGLNEYCNTATSGSCTGTCRPLPALSIGCPAVASSAIYAGFWAAAGQMGANRIISPAPTPTFNPGESGVTGLVVNSTTVTTTCTQSMSATVRTINTSSHPNFPALEPHERIVTYSFPITVTCNFGFPADQWSCPHVSGGGAAP
jgi:hypothetical protein